MNEQTAAKRQQRFELSKSRLNELATNPDLIVEGLRQKVENQQGLGKLKAIRRFAKTRANIAKWDRDKLIVRLFNAAEWLREKKEEAGLALEATKKPELNITKVGPFHEWKAVNMGNRDIEFAVLEDSNQVLLRINADHPNYQNYKKEGVRPLEMHTNFLAAEAVAEYVYKDSIKDYQNCYKRLRTEIGKIYEQQVTGKKFKSRGSIPFTR